MLVFGLCSLIYFSSCSDDDGYSLDKYWQARASVVEEDGNRYHFRLDDGTKLFVAATNGYYKPKSERAIINFTILGDETGTYDHSIRLNGVREILTKQVVELTAANADSIGSDKVEVSDMWSGGDFLNVNFSFLYAYGDRPHFINLVDNTTDAEKPTDGKIHLEFRHNAYKQPANSKANSTACFDLKPFRKEGVDSVNFIIKFRESDTVYKDYKVTYKYKETEETEKAEGDKKEVKGSDITTIDEVEIK
ncbi:hypothetical protein AwDysgo_04090 [Bacteroidales bacterium]|nr:hypothetical protein AwDysgo_04090 [Bacteroidales bacterium]